jgi:hypothetical protein
MSVVLDTKRVAVLVISLLCDLQIKLLYICVDMRKQVVKIPGL